MNRVKGYLIYLLIPAVPYLLMIYRPDIVDTVYQYLGSGEGHRYVWLLLIGALLWGLHAGICFDFKSNDVKAAYISFTKWFLSLILLVTSIYVLASNIVSFKNVLIFVCFSTIVYYVYAITYGKKSA